LRKTAPTTSQLSTPNIGFFFGFLPLPLSAVCCPLASGKVSAKCSFAASQA
jgi:hypothetical protein